ncbi:hypothetical protein P4O66_007677 [Electrophorus voltai]|uniref:Uncharacterized protein n=1 Tax=Electrophorus voltai TaxID=2609070 RepID=A0AAD8ZJY1_9TELE|nr:hypothetical protein P4O66_007677 [Electrophorus voltai]
MVSLDSSLHSGMLSWKNLVFTGTDSGMLSWKNLVFTGTDSGMLSWKNLVFTGTDSGMLSWKNLVFTGTDSGMLSWKNLVFTGTDSGMLSWKNLVVTGTHFCHSGQIVKCQQDGSHKRTQSSPRQHAAPTPGSSVRPTLLRAAYPQRAFAIAHSTSQRPRRKALELWGSEPSLKECPHLRTIPPHKRSLRWYLGRQRLFAIADMVSISEGESLWRASSTSIVEFSF